MTAGLLLAGYAATAGLFGPAVLRRRWALRSPRLAISLWLALALSWVIAVSLAALTLAVPFTMSWPGPGGGMAAGRAAPGGTVAAAAGLLLAAAVVLRVSGCLAGGLRAARRERRAHARFAAAAGLPDHRLGAIVIDDDTPLAYCLPGGRYRVVVSTATVAVLGPGQLQAVLAHERAHLRSRHHLLLTAAAALARAFPWVPLLAQAGSQIAVLAEMAADDAATRGHDPASLAAALVHLARAGARSAALTAGGTAAAARVERLLAPAARAGAPARVARRVSGAAALAVPLAVACLPLLLAACDVASQR